ncbi:MAG: type II secretion system F family protein [Candidatus Gastranaerophilaceae bacterium]|jgi:tight adherence protein B
MEILISILTGIFVTFILFSFFSNSEESINKELQIRLEKVKNKTFTHNGTKSQYKFAALFEDKEYRIKFVSNILNKFNLSGILKQRLKSANVAMSVDVFFLIVLSIPVPFLLIACIIPSFSFLIIPFGLILSFFPFLILHIKQQSRLDTFTKQFPDALCLISSSLRAGHSLHSAFQIVVNEMPYPINNVFKTVVDDISLGRDTRDAMNGMILTLPDSFDLKFFITAVLIQREIGGNLTEILDSLSNTIRERFKLLGQLKAQTAMTKMSGSILAVAPVVIGTILWFMNPKYMEPLFTDPIGRMSLALSIVFEIVGYIIIMKITKIRV